jgi:hypothetical protein
MNSNDKDDIIKLCDTGIMHCDAAWRKAQSSSCEEELAYGVKYLLLALKRMVSTTNTEVKCISTT